MIPTYLVQKSKSRSRFGDQNGQALIEYLLLVIVSVSLLLSLTYQILTPFQTFVQSYMGAYIQCLLDLGELPSLGNPDSQDLLQSQGCNAKFEGATWSAGRPPIGSNSNSNSNGSNGSSQNNSSNSNSSKGSSSSSNGGGGGSSSAGNNSNNLLVRSMHHNNNPEGTDGGSGSGKDSGGAGANGGGGSGFYRTRGSVSSNSGHNSGDRYVAILGLTTEDKKHLPRSPSISRKIAGSEGAYASSAKRFELKKPLAKAGEIKDEPMTFSDYLRFLIITAIVIAILVVLGSQALKISKDWEK